MRDHCTHLFGGSCRAHWPWAKRLKVTWPQHTPGKSKNFVLIQKHESNDKNLSLNLVLLSWACISKVEIQDLRNINRVESLKILNKSLFKSFSQTWSSIWALNSNIMVIHPIWPLIFKFKFILFLRSLDVLKLVITYQCEYALSNEQKISTIKIV